MMDVSHDRRHTILWMSIIKIWWMSNKHEYDGCPSFMNMMNVHHLWMRWISFMYNVRRYWFTDWIKGTGERETIDQGLDGIEGKYHDEEIRTMALMEFMKLMEPAQLMEGLIFIELIYLIKLMEPMKTIGYRCFLAALAALYLHI